MTRKLNERQRAVTAVRENFDPDWKQQDHTSGRSARQSSPVQVGDVVRFVDGDAIREALVVGVGATLDTWGDWRPYYTVRVRRRDGQFADVWRRTWPGFIARATGRA